MHQGLGVKTLSDLASKDWPSSIAHSRPHADHLEAGLATWVDLLATIL